MLGVLLIMFSKLTANPLAVYSILDLNDLKPEEVGDCFADIKDRNAIFKIRIYFFLFVCYVFFPEVCFLRIMGIVFYNFSQRNIFVNVRDRMIGYCLYFEINNSIWCLFFFRVPCSYMKNFKICL